VPTTMYRRSMSLASTTTNTQVLVFTELRLQDRSRHG